MIIEDEAPKTICRRCGRRLTAPRSVAAGYGPVCYQEVFGRPQPRAPGEETKTSRRSGRVSELDLSELSDLRTWFE